MALNLCGGDSGTGDEMVCFSGFGCDILRPSDVGGGARVEVSITFECNGLVAPMVGDLAGFRAGIGGDRAERFVIFRLCIMSGTSSNSWLDLPCLWYPLSKRSDIEETTLSR
jgi:hypothetical protein